MSEVTDYYGGTNSFECPWPEGATEACVKWVQNGTLTGWAPITDLDCVPRNEEFIKRVAEEDPRV